MPAPQVRTRLQMPFLLMSGMGFAMFFACVAILVFLVFAIALPLGGGSYSLNGRVVSRAEFLHSAWPLIVLWPLGAGIIIAIAYALWKEIPWSREAIMVYSVLPFIASLVASLWMHDRATVIASCIWSAIVAAGMGWYLYRKATVVAYYRAVSEQYPATRRRQ